MQSNRGFRLVAFHLDSKQGPQMSNVSPLPMGSSLPRVVLCPAVEGLAVWKHDGGLTVGRLLGALLRRVLRAIPASVWEGQDGAWREAAVAEPDVAPALAEHDFVLVASPLEHEIDDLLGIRRSS